VRSKAKTKEKIGPLKDEKGNIINDDSATCKVLNNFFASVFTHETMQHMP
jgi:hypothetical protein